MKKLIELKGQLANPEMKAKQKKGRKEAEARAEAARAEANKSKEELWLIIENLFNKFEKMANYYEILGVGREASFQEIAVAFRGLALTYHPMKKPASLAQTNFKFC